MNLGSIDWNIYLSKTSFFFSNLKNSNIEEYSLLDYYNIYKIKDVKLYDELDGEDVAITS